MKLPRAPRDHLDMLWLSGNATNVARSRATGIPDLRRGVSPRAWARATPDEIVADIAGLIAEIRR